MHKAQKSEANTTEEAHNNGGNTPQNDTSDYRVEYVSPSQFLLGSSSLTPSISQSNPLVDPDYAAFVSQYGGDVPNNVVYEAKRAQRQMAHYFDVGQYRKQQDQAPPAVPPSNAAGVAKKKPTKKELEQFRKRKEERKKIKNRWLYE